MWTTEQQQAIDKEGTNIIVSAGAGSGKTAVLTARVIRKLFNGVNINQLLILTFTNAAAFEMKEKIKKAIKKNNLTNQLSLIDEAYITTFDSFSLSMVKKYHYLLNISKNINICEASLINVKKSEYLDEIFNYMYEIKDEDFLSMINDFCIKNDKEIKKSIIDISSKLDLKYNKDKYLDTYIEQYYNDSYIEKDIDKYVYYIKDKINNINKLLDDFSYAVDIDIYHKVSDQLNDLLNSNSYNDICNSLNKNIKNPMIKDLDNEAKGIKQNIFDTIKELKELCFYKDIGEIKETILITKKYAKATIKIIKLLDKKMDDFKYENDLYEFNDISKMAINIMDTNEFVRDELKYTFNEIMIDEYQDTSDLQELFISLISNNNVYMVGDIKQSIYRFRNANPYIFKEKYDNYSKDIGGYKIDLVKNFRSRKEVLDNINLLFNKIMDDKIGGANYIESHQMVFGNKSYDEDGKTTQNNNFEIYNYTYDKDFIYNREEIEIFIIAKDIKDKINNKYKIFDKETNTIRDIKYNDFVILMDRSTNFDLYKKVFEYLNIPLTKCTDTSLTDKNDILIIKNILNLLISLKNKIYDEKFKYSFVSIGRSYLYRYSDEEIFDYINNSNYMESTLIKDALDIVKTMDYSSVLDIYNMIIDKFDFYYNLIKVSDIQNSMIRIESLYNISNNLSEIGYSIENFSIFLDSLIQMSNDDKSKQIKISISDSSQDSVKIMTIHKSKGLEYHICYFPGLYAKFNIKESSHKFNFDNKYGFILPYYKDGIGNTIYKKMFKDNYILEEISEKVRLWYVALTRCKEKMIIVCNLDDSYEEELNGDIKLKYRSFLQIMNSVGNDIKDYIVNVSLDSIDLTKDYELIKAFNYKDNITKDNRKILLNTLNISKKKLTKNTFSKKTPEIISDNNKDNMKFGKYMHSLFEYIDFKNPNIDKLQIEDKYKEKINTFLSLPIDFKNAKIYKEYEFIYKDSESINHGIIDLMLEYESSIIIIDYKLSNINDEAYVKQLNGYKNYIVNKTKKDVTVYLYSINNNELKEIKG